MHPWRLNWWLMISTHLNHCLFYSMSNLRQLNRLMTLHVTTDLTCFRFCCRGYFESLATTAAEAAAEAECKMKQLMKHYPISAIYRLNHNKTNRCNDWRCLVNSWMRRHPVNHMCSDDSGHRRCILIHPQTIHLNWYRVTCRHLKMTRLSCWMHCYTCSFSPVNSYSVLSLSHPSL